MVDIAVIVCVRDNSIGIGIFQISVIPVTSLGLVKVLCPFGIDTMNPCSHRNSFGHRYVSEGMKGGGACPLR